MDNDNISVLRRLHSESTGWVSFYALLVSTLVPAGFRHVALKNGIDDARMLGCFPFYDLLVGDCFVHHDMSTSVENNVCGLAST